MHNIAIVREPASVTAGEITDKGYINERAVLARRAVTKAVATVNFRRSADIGSSSSNIPATSV